MQQAQQSVAVERRSPVGAPSAIIVNDTGLLSIDQVFAFREFLQENGVQVRDSGAGQFFHFRMPETKRWLPVERGRASAPVTPEVLRPLITQFNAQPNAAVVVSIQPESVMQPRPPAPMSRYLSDLRDDLALHAPLQQLPNESVLGFAYRRWEYADVMLATRSK